MKKPSGGNSGGAGAGVHLAAFGKHPGWDDHIEDLGLDTDALVALKRTLYFEGFGRNIDSGAWDRLEAAQRVEGGRHVFIRSAGGDVVVGRMWPSRDGKGRAKYPMVICAHCQDCPVAWAEREVLPRLEEIERQCVRTESAGDVRAALDAGREALRRLREESDPAAADRGEPAAALAALADRPDMGPDRQGILRVLYQLSRDVSTSGGESAPAAAAALHLRVPADPPSAPASAGLWLAFLRTQFDPATPLLAIVPLGEPWIDLIEGEPGAQQLFCIRAGLKAVPLTSDIPYGIEADFVAQVEGLIEKSRAGQADRLAATAGLAPPSQARPKPPRAPLGTRVKPLVDLLRRRWKLWAIVLAAMAALAVLSSLLPRLGGPGAAGPPADGPAPKTPAPPGFDAARWRGLCTAYYGWFARFHEAAGERRAGPWGRDPQLAEVLRLLADARAQQVEFDPRTLADARGWDVTTLSDYPPEGAMTPAAGAKIARAAGVIEAVAELLQPRRWAMLGQVERLAGDWAKRGWGGAAGFLNDLAAGAAPAPNADVAAGVEAVLAAGPQAVETERRWQEVAAASAAMEQSGSKVLARFGDYARASASSAAAGADREVLPRLAERVQRIAEAAARCAAFVQADWRTQVARELFLADGEVPLPAGETPGRATFEQWLARAREYCRLSPDPRAEADWAGRIDDIRRKIGVLPPEAAKTPLADLTLAEAAVVRMTQIPAIRKNEAEIAKAVTDNARRLDRLAEAVGVAIIVSTGEPGEWLATVRKQQDIAASAAVNRQWRTSRDALIGALTAAQLKADAERYVALHRSLEKVRQFLAGLDSAEAMPAALEPAPPATAGLPPEKVAAAIAARREAAIAEAVGAVRWAGGLPEASDTGFAGRFDQIAGKYRGWLADLRGLLEDLSRIERGLAECLRSNEPAPGMPKGLSGAAAALAARAAFEQFRPPLAGALARVAELGRIESSTDAAQLARWCETAPADRPEVAVAAWRRVGELRSPAWPAGLDDLKKEALLRRKAAAAVLSVADAARRKALLAELAGEGRRRWEACFAALGRSEDIEAAIELKAGFAVEDDRLGEGDRFRLLLYDFRRLAAATADEGELAGRVARFARAVAEKLPAAAKRPEIAAFLSSLTGLERSAGGADELAGKAGPSASDAAGKWTATVREGGMSVDYSLAGKGLTVTFVRVQPAGGAARACYLAATEAPVGLFIDVIDSADKWGDLRPLLRKFESGFDPRLGPRSWQWRPNGKSIEKADQWLFSLTRADAAAQYPADARPPGPSADHPVQYVGPAAAMYFARLLGCRLPTAAEWAAAWRIQQDSDKPPAEARKPNLRDKTWARQVLHVAAAEAQGKRIPWPDADVFWPERLGPENRLLRQKARTLDGDDGVLWFEAVASPRRPFSHLVGNVAEYVYEDAVGWDKAFRQPGELEAGKVAAYLHENIRNVRVVGGSAMSCPQVWDGSADRPFAAAQAVTPAEAAGGYSDVGFRLAFTAPTEPYAERVKRFLSAAGYPAPAR